MSQSFINSSFFIKDSEDSGDESTTEESVTYEKISEDKDIYLIRTDNKSYKLHRKKLIKSLKLLHHSAYTLISDLDTNMMDRFNSTIESTRILYNSKALKDLILNDIREIFHNVKKPVPGTVGAFFVGCFNDDLFTGPLGCNPRCASMRCDAGFECSDTVLTFSNDIFSNMNNKHTTNAYIYIKNSNFRSFSLYHLELLKDAGIKSMILIYSNKDGSYREVTNKIYLDTLLKPHDVNTFEITGIIIFVIILILILFVLIYLYHFNYIQI